MGQLLTQGTATFLSAKAKELAGTQVNFTSKGCLGPEPVGMQGDFFPKFPQMIFHWPGCGDALDIEIYQVQERIEDRLLPGVAKLAIKSEYRPSQWARINPGERWRINCKTR